MASEPAKKKWKPAFTPTPQQDVEMLLDIMDLKGNVLHAKRNKGSHENAETFRKVIEICAGIPIFWMKLRTIQYVKMLPCVNRSLKDLFEPKQDHLPYWGTWSQYLRYHSWAEINKFMDFKMNLKKYIKDTENVFDNDAHRYTKRFSLHKIWIYMTTVRCKDPKEYAALIVKYRKYQKVQKQRRETFFSKNPIPVVKNRKNMNAGCKTFKVCMEMCGFEECHWDNPGGSWSWIKCLHTGSDSWICMTREENILKVCGEEHITKIKKILDMMESRNDKPARYFSNAILCQVYLMYKFILDSIEFKSSEKMLVHPHTLEIMNKDKDIVPIGNRFIPSKIYAGIQSRMKVNDSVMDDLEIFSDLADDFLLPNDI